LKTADLEINEAQLEGYLSLGLCELPSGCQCLLEPMLALYILHNLQLNSDCDVAPVVELQSYDEKIKYAVDIVTFGSYESTTFGIRLLGLIEKCKMYQKAGLGNAQLSKQKIMDYCGCNHDIGGCVSC
jgi:hypothetical protein